MTWLNERQASAEVRRCGRAVTGALGEERGVEGNEKQRRGVFLVDKCAVGKKVRESWLGFCEKGRILGAGLGAGSVRGCPAAKKKKGRAKRGEAGMGIETDDEGNSSHQ